MRDIQIIDNETVFYYRVSGVVIKDNKILNWIKLRFNQSVQCK